MILPARELMPVVRAALERGQRVRMTVTGSSMIPFLRNEDVVELEPARKLRLGDMVLVRTETDRYVLHRIVRMDGAAFFLQGDAQSWSEGPFTAETGARARHHCLTQRPSPQFGTQPLATCRISVAGHQPARIFSAQRRVVPPAVCARRTAADRAHLEPNLTDGHNNSQRTTALLPARRA